MRLTCDEMIENNERLRREEAIASIIVWHPGNYKPWCKSCDCYICGEFVWKFKWPSEWDDTEMVCANCYPTKELLVAAIRNGEVPVRYRKDYEWGWPPILRRTGHKRKARAKVQTPVDPDFEEAMRELDELIPPRR